MPKRRDPLEIVRTDGAEQMTFLTAAGLSGPHDTEHGIVYRNDSIEVSLSYYGPREPEISTSVHRLDPDGTWRWANLACLFVACGYGVPQDVPGNAPNAKVALNRVIHQAAALRRVFPRLVTEEGLPLVRLCQSQLLPLPE